MQHQYIFPKLAFIVLTLGLTSLAQANDNNFVLNYASAPWNTNSKTLDSAYMFLRDKNSGKIMKILLEETEPDSSLFRGQFSFNLDTNKPVDPEVYIPPENLRNDARAIENFNRLLQQNKIQAQPLFLQKEKNKQLLDVYDTQEQATRARQAHTQQTEAAKKAEKAALVKPQPSESALQVAKLAEKQMALAQLAKDAAQRELSRLRLEQLEQQRLEQKRKEQEALNAAEQKRREQEADQLAKKAIAHYMKSEFDKAEPLFRRATELSPNNQQHYFMYGVSLYRVNKYDEALVTLKLSETNPQNELEKKYYMGLIHFRLKELALARQHFAQVRQANNATLSPSAAFYEGLVLYSEEDLIPAQAAFEYVLDNSSDPTMDQRAEEYIEKIAKLLEFKKMAQKKIFINAKAGLQYDSNILLSPDNTDVSSGTATSKGGGRWMVGGDAEYRFFFKEKSDFSGKIAASNTQSFSTDFTEADPLTLTTTLPYNKKGMWGKRGYKLGLTPGYDMLYLDYDRSGQQTNILSSVMGNVDFMLVMAEDWFSSYTLDIRQDDSLIAGTDGGDDDADALKYSFKKTEVRFLDGSKKRALIGFLGYTVNDADGKDKYYNKIELGAIYAAPILKYQNTSFNSGLVVYLQNYDQATEKREDQNITLMFGLNKILNETWSWSTNASYINNSSNIAEDDYSKYVVMGTLNYSWSR